MSISQCNCGDIVGQCGCMRREMEALEARNVELEKKLEIAVEGLRFIRSSTDCRNEAEQEQCAHAAERTLAAIKGEGV